MAAGLRHKRSAHSWEQEAGVDPDMARKTLPELINGISPRGWTWYRSVSPHPSICVSSAQGVIPDSRRNLDLEPYRAPCLDPRLILNPRAPSLCQKGEPREGGGQTPREWG